MADVRDARGEAPWPSDAPCLACGRPVKADEEYRLVAGDVTSMPLLVGWAHEGACYDKAAACVRLGRVEDLPGFAFFKAFFQPTSDSPAKKDQIE